MRLRATPWDFRLGARTAALSCVALGLTALISWITDERGVGRSIGIVPLTPVAAAVAVAIALVPVRASGETRALVALGVRPIRVRLAALVTALVLSSTAALLVGTGFVDASSLFPPRAPATDWRVDTRVPASPAFESQRRSARVDADGRIERTPASAAQQPAAVVPPRVAGAFAIALAGGALAMWMASPSRRRIPRTIVSAVAYGVAQVAAFQAVGAGVIPPALVVVPPLALLSFSAVELWEESRVPRGDA